MSHNKELSIAELLRQDPQIATRRQIDKRCGYPSGTIRSTIGENGHNRLKDLDPGFDIALQWEVYPFGVKSAMSPYHRFTSLDQVMLHSICTNKGDYHLHEILKRRGRFILDIDVSNESAIQAILGRFGTNDNFTPNGGFRKFIEELVIDIFGDKYPSGDKVHWTTVGENRDGLMGDRTNCGSLEDNGHSPFAWIDGCRPGKISYHLVLPVYTLKLTDGKMESRYDWGWLGWFYWRLNAMIKESMPELGIDIVDRNLANNNHPLRLPGQTTLVFRNGKLQPDMTKILRPIESSENFACPWFSGIELGFIPKEYIVDHWKCCDECGDCCDNKQCVRGSYNEYISDKHQKTYKEYNGWSLNPDAWEIPLMNLFGVDDVDTAYEKLCEFLVVNKIMEQLDDLQHDTQWANAGNMLPYSIHGNCRRCERNHGNVHPRLFICPNGNLWFYCQRWMDDHSSERNKCVCIIGRNAPIKDSINSKFGQLSWAQFLDKYTGPEVSFTKSMIPEIVNDLRRCIGYIVQESPFYIVSGTDNCYIATIPKMVQMSSKYNFYHKYQDENGREKYNLYRDIIVNYEGSFRYDRFVYKTQGQVDGKTLNIFRGYTAKRVEFNDEDIQLPLSYIRDRLCNGNDQSFEYVIKWLAWMVQKKRNRKQHYY